MNSFSFKSKALYSAFIMICSYSFHINALYITDDNYESIITNESSIVEPLIEISNLQIINDDDIPNDNSFDNKTIAKFNNLMAKFFSELKTKISTCTNKEDSWYFFNTYTITVGLVTDMIHCYYQRNKEITLNFITMLNNTFDVIENEADKKNAKILAWHAFLNAHSFKRTKEGNNGAIYWDEKSKQAFMYFTSEDSYPINIFKILYDQEIPEKYELTSEQKDFSRKFSNKDNLLYEILFQKTTNSNIFLPICTAFFERSLKNIHENRKKFSPKNEDLNKNNQVIKKEGLITQSTSNTTEKTDLVGYPSKSTSIDWKTRFLQTIKNYAVPIVLGTVTVSATIYCICFYLF